MDICGCKGSDLVAFNSSLLEGDEFAKDFLKEFNEEEPIAPIPMARFADQTFWGAAVPFAIMPKFGRRNVKRLPFFWWHTKEDTIDKVDEAVVLRDAKVIAKLAAIFANIERLPAQMAGFVDVMKNRLAAIDRELCEDFDLSDAHEAVDRLKEKISEYEKALENEAYTDDAIIKIAGEMVRITYTASSPYHQDPAVKGAMFPALSAAMGLTPDNTEVDYYLAVQTRFVRQRNRLCGQIDQIIEACDHQMYRWKTEK
jgi:aminopeptidase YwaD